MLPKPSKNQTTRRGGYRTKHSISNKIGWKINKNASSRTNYWHRLRKCNRGLISNGHVEDFLCKKDFMSVLKY